MTKTFLIVSFEGVLARPMLGLFFNGPIQRENLWKLQKPTISYIYIPNIFYSSNVSDIWTSWILCIFQYFEYFWYLNISKYLIFAVNVCRSEGFPRPMCRWFPTQQRCIQQHQCCSNISISRLIFKIFNISKILIDKM